MVGSPRAWAAYDAKDNSNRGPHFGAEMGGGAAAFHKHSDHQQAFEKRRVGEHQARQVPIGLGRKSVGAGRTIESAGPAYPPLKFRGLDTMELAARVAGEAQRLRADAVFVDEGGLGAGVVDRLRQLRVAGVHGINFGGKANRVLVGDSPMLCANKRAEIWASMREWLKGGAIPDDMELRADLTGVEYGYNIRQEIQLESKKDMKARGLASPDNGDALALTFAYDVSPSPRAGGEHRPAMVQWEYDPLSEDRM